MLSPAASPAPSAQQEPSSSLSRKRARSSSSEASSSKRAMSEDPTTTGTEALDAGQSQSFAALKLGSVPPLEEDMDSYMRLQDQGSDLKTAGPNGTSDDMTLEIPVDPEERYNLIKSLMNEKMKEGEVWYLVARSWYRRWEKACTGAVDKEGAVLESQLGPVDNSTLASEDGTLLSSSLMEGVDVEFVPKEAWILLVEWYGQPNHSFPRNVILRGLLKEPALELRPPVVQALLLKDVDLPNGMKGPIPRGTVSSQATLRILYSLLLRMLKLDVSSDRYRVWKVDSLELEESTYLSRRLAEDSAVLMPSPKNELEMSKTLDESSILSEDAFVVEVAINGSWIVDANKILAQGSRTSNNGKEFTPLFAPGTDFFSALSSKAKGSKPGASDEPTVVTIGGLKPAPSISAASKYKTEKNVVQPGTLGLGNMGNTCFMNSALQCLAHTEILVEYFITGVFKDELNPDNPLGMQGAVAEVFGALLRRIWSPQSSATSYSPREFKMELQRFAPQFSGYQQHDSQELVAFLLDGLHEDLNRVLKKPYVEKPDWEGGGDKELVELALKSWDGYKRRNDSVIVDLFQGQYKSTLVCPECQKVSITFDPFMYLTLPLPVQKKWQHSIFYIPWDTTKPHVKVPVEVNRNASFKDVRQLLGRWMDVDADKLLTLEVFSNRFYKDLDDSVMVGDMTDNDNIVCFELPCHAQQSRTWKPNDDPERNHVILPVHLTRDLGGSRSAFRSPSQGFAHPFILVLDADQAKDKQQIYEAIVDRLQRWTRSARDLYQWEHEVTANHVTLRPSHVTNAVTEFKENGDIVTVLEDAPEEGDIVDAKSLILEEDGPESMPDDSVKRCGPKADLFEMHIQSGHDKYGTGSSWSGSAQRWERWESREDEPSLVKKGDALYCEWDENLKTYYFGDDRRFENGRWHESCWGEFIHPEYEASQAAARSKKAQGINLQDCLEEFTKEEQLGEDDLWYCPQCKKHQQATKKFDLWSVPDILVVHLKRFSNSRILRDKIDAFVDFPIEGLDLGSYCGERDVAKRLETAGVKADEVGMFDLNEPLLYDLYGVDEHIGGLGGGHYRAYAKHHQTEQWYHFDDSYVSKARASDAVNANAYLLFYKRRSTRPHGGKTFDKIEAARSTLRDTSEDVAQLPTPEEDDAPPISASKLTKLRELKPHRYPTPPTDSRTSPATLLSPRIDETDPPSFEAAQFDNIVDVSDDNYTYSGHFSGLHDRSGAASPVSSTGAEVGLDELDTFGVDLSGPPNSDDWNARSTLRNSGSGGFGPSSVQDWNVGNTWRPTEEGDPWENTGTLKLADDADTTSATIVPAEESSLLDIDL